MQGKEEVHIAETAGFSTSRSCASEDGRFRLRVSSTWEEGEAGLLSGQLGLATSGASYAAGSEVGII